MQRCLVWLSILLGVAGCIQTAPAPDGSSTLPVSPTTTAASVSLTSDLETNAATPSDDHRMPETFEQERDRRAADPPVLENLAVDFGAMEGQDFGDFYDPQVAASRNYLSAFRPIDPFGSGFGTQSDENSSSINFWVRPNVTLEAPISGIIHAVDWQEDSKDFEIHVRRDAQDWWDVSLDHVQPLDDDRQRFEALLGTSIRAGDAWAKPSLASTIGRGIGTVSESIHGFFEIQVNFENHFGDPSTYFQEAHCPALSLDVDIRSMLDAKVAELERRWEAAKNDSTIYDESQFTDTPACVGRVQRTD